MLVDLLLRKKYIKRYSLLHYVCNKEANIFSIPFVAIVNEDLHSG